MEKTFKTSLDGIKRSSDDAGMFSAGISWSVRSQNGVGVSDVSVV